MFVNQETNHNEEGTYRYQASEWWLTPLLLFHPLREAPNKVRVTLKTKIGAWEGDNVPEPFTLLLKKKKKSFFQSNFINCSFSLNFALKPMDVFL